MPIEERDIIKIILGIVIALLLGVSEWIKLSASQEKWIIIVALAYVLFAVHKRRI